MYSAICSGDVSQWSVSMALRLILSPMSWLTNVVTCLLSHCPPPGTSNTSSNRTKRTWTNSPSSSYADQHHWRCQTIGWVPNVLTSLLPARASGRTLNFLVGFGEEEGVCGEAHTSHYSHHHIEAQTLTSSWSFEVLRRSGLKELTRESTCTEAYSPPTTHAHN